MIPHLVYGPRGANGAFIGIFSFFFPNHASNCLVSIHSIIKSFRFYLDPYYARGAKTATE